MIVILLGSGILSGGQPLQVAAYRLLMLSKHKRIMKYERYIVKYFIELQTIKMYSL